VKWIRGSTDISSRRFVLAEAELFRIYGGGIEIPDQRMREAIASGAERTMEQDPCSRFRLLSIFRKGIISGDK
jgi:hypothetical protein